MVFRSKPFRQSVFLAQEPASVARAELQQDVIDILPRLTSLAKCTNCEVVGDTIYFGDNGVFELDVTPLLPHRIAIFSLVVDRDRAPVGLSINYEIVLTKSPFEGSEYITLYQGKLAVLDPSDMASRYVSRLQAPVTGGVVLRLSASRVALPLKYLILSAIRTNINYSVCIPFPSTVTGGLLSMWRLPVQPHHYVVYFFWNSLDGNTATLTYTESGVDITTLSTTSTTTVISSVGRVWRRDVRVTYSASSNAVVKAFFVDFYVWPPAFPAKALQASYSTTSTSYVKYTPLSLSTVYARIRRIVVSASSNARWYVNVNNNKVLDSAWGITSIDLNPPVEATTVDLYLASADGASATASIIIIYDEVPARL